MTVFKGAAMIAAGALLTGCVGLGGTGGVTTGPQALGGQHTVAYTDSGSRGVHVFQGSADPGRYRVCIEPSPDTASTTTENFGVGGFDTTTRGDTGQYGGVNIEGEALSLDTTRNAGTVIDRERAIEVFRETLFQSCMAYAQGVISEEEYASFLRAASGGALAMAAMDSIGGSDGTDDALVAEIMSTLAQIGLFGLLLTDDAQGAEVNATFRELAEGKVDQLDAMIEAMRGQADLQAALAELMRARIAAGELEPVPLSGAPSE
jgi:hypothetical protein